MNDDLKAKLERALQTGRYADSMLEGEDVDALVADIDQAYKDAGFKRYEDSRGHILLPGQEWYERFMKELSGRRGTTGWNIYEVILEAAKRVARLE